MTPSRPSATSALRGGPSGPSPARKGPRAGARAFAATWWGQAWVDALEASTLDAGRLSRGRTYARKGMVHPVTVTAGVLTAKVEGSTPRPYDAAVHVPAFTDAQWGTLLDAIAARAAHTAALLDGDMPRELAEEARAAGISLLPQPSELDPECSCPDWGYPCKHAAALCYATAGRVDEDPFVLFALRGRDRRAVLDGLRTRRQAHAATVTAPAADDEGRLPQAEGVPAREAFAAWDGTFSPASLSEDSLAAGEQAADTPAPLTVPPPPDSRITLEDLEILTRDTAQRARGLASGTTASLYCTAAADSVRMAARGVGEEWFHRLVTGTGIAPHAFARLVSAMRYGGPEGVAVAREPFTPAPAAMAAARTALAEDDGDGDTPAPAVKQWRNRLTLDAEDIQLRLGPDGRWYPYANDGSDTTPDWWPCAPAVPDPATALLNARAATNRPRPPRLRTRN